MKRRVMIFTVIFLATLGVGFCTATVLFEDDFDSHPDWSPPQRRGVSTSDKSHPVYGNPRGYSDWRVGGSENEEGVGHNTLNIDGTHHRGGEGKAFVFWTEMSQNWGADGLLGVDLEGGYPEIYIRFYIKFQKDWRWCTNLSPMQKFLHVSHYDPEDADSLYDYFSPTQNKPRYVMQAAKWNKGASDVSISHSLSWYDNGPTPSNTRNYFPGGGYAGSGTDWSTNSLDYDTALFIDGNYASYLPHKKGMMGDGEWHCWEWRLKMNTADGVSDGALQWWQDGLLLYSKTDILWANSESQCRAWNHVWLGGNNLNTYGLESDPWTHLHEQWYAIDDFVISTEFVGLDNCYPHNFRIQENSRRVAMEQ